MACTEAQLEYAKRYRLLNSEKHQQYQKEYWPIYKQSKLYEIEKRSKQKARKKDPIQFIFWAAKTKCKRLGIEFSITKEDLILPKICPLLGIPLFVGYGIRGPNSPSIDRIDPTKGYVKDNVWVISWRANDLKKNATLKELKMLTQNLEKKIGELCG